MDLPTRALPDGRTLHLMPLTFWRSRIGVCAPGESLWFIDEW